MHTKAEMSEKNFTLSLKEVYIFVIYLFIKLTNGKLIYYMNGRSCSFFYVADCVRVKIIFSNSNPICAMHWTDYTN